MAQKEWKKTLIQTAADDMLAYLAEHKEADVNELATELDLSPETVREWGKALAKSGLLETRYTTGGLVLRQPEEGSVVTEERAEDVKEDIAETIAEAKTHISEREKVVEGAQDRLEQLGAILQKDYAETEVLREEMADIAEREEELREEMDAVFEEIQTYLEQIEAAEEDVNAFLDLQGDLEDNIAVLKKLSKHSKNLKKMEEALETVEEKDDRARSILERLREHFPDIRAGEGKEVQNLLDGTVEEVRDRLKDFDGDLEKVREMEKGGKNRKTVFEHIEREEKRRGGEDGD